MFCVTKAKGFGTGLCCGGPTNEAKGRRLQPPHHVATVRQPCVFPICQRAACDRVGSAAASMDVDRLGPPSSPGRLSWLVDRERKGGASLQVETRGALFTRLLFEESSSCGAGSRATHTQRGRYSRPLHRLPYTSNNLTHPTPRHNFTTRTQTPFAEPRAAGRTPLSKAANCFQPPTPFF